MTKQYVDFERVTDDALAVAERQLHLTLTTGQHNRLSRAFLHLDLWQDAPETLRALRASGVRVIVLANFSPRMLRANADHAGIAPLFEALVSTDERRTYKPDPRAYRLALDHLHLDKREVLFVASAGWDAAGAKAFGLPTVWVNRVGQPDELLGAVPDRTVGALAGVLSFVLPSSTAPRHAS